jgi:pimeloyl-ACP methyl ester carboxylesterase
MLCSLVRVKTIDGIELQGLHFASEINPRKSVVIHLHGTWGNFYGNPFIDYFADQYIKNGFSFLTVNTRGHDEGSNTERLEQCIFDINTWVDYALRQGYHEIILQGHSLGAIKIIYGLLHPYLIPDVNNITKIILLSPFDIRAFYASGNLVSLEEKINQVEFIANKNPDKLVPNDIWSMWQISAGTYLDLVGPKSEADIFPFRKKTLMGSPLSKIKIPVFAAIGGKDFAAFPTPREAFNQLKQLDNVYAAYIEDAPHNFAQYESELLEEIINWIKCN